VGSGGGKVSVINRFFHTSRGSIMPTIRLGRAAYFVACLIAVVATTANAQGTACANKGSCAEVSSFVANVTDFRMSVSGRYRVVTTTVRFQNKLNRPLILGYVPRSGIATDDRGNRYQIGNDAGVRGIGVITSNALDVKFILQPGESSDARFEFGWSPGQEIFGTTYQVELAIREIDPVSATQYTLGKEHALRFTGFGAQGTTTVASAGGAVAPAPPAAVIPAAAPIADPCAGAPRCYGAGPFVAQVSNLNGTTVGSTRNHLVRVTMKLSNLTAQPIILAYHTGSSSAIDNYGNRYTWGRPGTHDVSAAGIGIVEGNKADPQFILRPGESRDATFSLVRYNAGNNPIGTGYSYDLVIDQLEPLPSGQIRSLRSYSVGFHDLGLSGSGVGANQAAPPNKLIEALKKKLSGKPK
jgi:hypothetical protein